VISVVIPLYRCEACIPELHGRLVRVLTEIGAGFEIVYVNDASPQGDWAIVRDYAKVDSRVKAIDLSRNFGQHYAITAGIDHAEGDWVVVMDGDLQDPPEEIPRLYAKAQEGFDVVFGRKPNRKHGVMKRFLSRGFSRVLGFLTDQKLDNAVTHFSIVSRDVALNLRKFKERNRSYAYFVTWLGFKTGYIDVEHHERFAGDGSYTLRKQLRLAFEMTVSQSDKPLRVTIAFGFTIALLAFAYGTFQILRYLFWGYPIVGWTSVIVSIYFIGGLLFIALGVVGLYIGRIFEETKGRPLYVIKTAMNIGQAQKPELAPIEKRAV
jgi:polyisoprenyl-phosphate glycosyltransferase